MHKTAICVLLVEVCFCCLQLYTVSKLNIDILLLTCTMVYLPVATTVNPANMAEQIWMRFQVGQVKGSKKSFIRWGPGLPVTVVTF